MTAARLINGQPVQRLSYDDVLSRLDGVSETSAGATALCPAHEDTRNSLSVSVGDDGKILLNCHAGCGFGDILSALGIAASQLFPPKSNGHQGNGRSAKSNGKPKAKANKSTPAPKGYGHATVEEAIQQAEGSIGKPKSHAWPYHLASGQHICTVCRWDFPNGQKTYRPITLIDGQWYSAGMPEPRPLYRLLEIIAEVRHDETPTKPIWICEGEKAADALRNIGLTVTTSAHGANSAKGTDWSPLAGREVIISPDFNAPGEKYCEDVIAILSELTPKPTVRVVRLPGLPNGGDGWDWCEQRDASEPETLRAELSVMADAAEIIAGPADDSPMVTPIGQLIKSYPHLREPVIDHLLRQGEICNLIAKSKVGKSWTAYGLALSVVAGRDWLDRFPCRRGRVLLIDNELHPENLAHRIPAVAEEMRILQSDFHDAFHVCSLRGRLKSILDMKSFFDEIEPGTYSLIIIDALYRMFPPEMSENDNAAMAAIYNALDAYAAATGAAFVIIHHATKGEQGGKDIVDVGSGASAQARAADTHLILRPHEEENCVVLDAVVRSFERVDPLVLRWDFPCWTLADELNPELLKGTKQAKESEIKQQRFEEKRKRVVEFLARKEYRTQGATQTAIKNGTGISVALLAVLNSLVDDDNLTTCDIVHPKNKSVQPAWKIKPDEAAERLKDGFEGRNLILQSGSSPSLKDGIPLKGEFHPSIEDGLPKSLKDGFAPEDETENQSAKTGKRKLTKSRKASA